MSLARPISSNFTSLTVSIFGGYVSYVCLVISIFLQNCLSLRLRKARFVYLFFFFRNDVCLLELEHLELAVNLT